MTDNQPPSRTRWLAGLVAVSAAVIFTVRRMRRRSDPPIAQTVTPPPPAPQPKPIPEDDTAEMPAVDAPPSLDDLQPIEPVQDNQPTYSLQRWASFGLFFIGLVLVIIALPYEWATAVFSFSVVGALTAGLYMQRQPIRAWWSPRWQAYRGIRRRTPRPTLLLPKRPPMLLAVIELAIVIFIALYVTEGFRYNNHFTHLRGREAEWLTSSAYLAADTLHDYGYIPLWQPWLEFGEPLIDNPFTFVLNPLSMGPSLLYGGQTGIKLSVMVYAVFAGVGGWFLGWALGLGSVGRVLLGLLILGKGNMPAMIGEGYYQLGVSQAYLPWVTGGAIVVLRGGRRWAVALTGIMFALLFFAGNIWYTLPLLLSLILLTLSHLVKLRPGEWLNLIGLRRLILAGLFTIALSAMTLLPIWLHQEMFGGHEDEKEAGAIAPMGRVIDAYFNDDGMNILTMQVFEPTRGLRAGKLHFYYSFVTPLWYAALMFVVIPPIYPFLYRPGLRGLSRIWWVGILMVIICTLWGAGGNPVFVWLYEHVPLLGQWRFVGRALAVASFWIAVLIAMRVDGLLRAIIADFGADVRRVLFTLRHNWRMLIADEWVLWGLRAAVVGVLTALSFVAGRTVAATWEWHALPGQIEMYTSTCVGWLRQTYPDEALTARRHNYDLVTAFQEFDVRLYDVEADYFPLSIPPTIGHIDMTTLHPRFAVAWRTEDPQILTEWGYRPVLDGPRIGENFCLYELREPPLSYAFTIPFFALNEAVEALPAALTTPIADYGRLPDTIAMRVQADPDSTLVVTVQEIAYPGWAVWVDGEPAQLESVGYMRGMIGVQIPPGTEEHVVIFAYRPPLVFIGGFITLIAAGIITVYLLEVDKWWRRWRRKRHNHS